MIGRLVGFARREVGAVAGLFALGGLAWTFMSVAEEVSEGETQSIDRAILEALRQPVSPHEPIGPHWLTAAAADLTALGSIPVLAVVVLTVCGLFVSVKKPRQAMILLAASISAIGWSQGLKAIFDRQRPDTVFHVVEVVNASFPSGHAMLSASVYLTLAALAARFTEARRTKVFVVAAGLAVTLIVGITRVFLGVHWPTDVLAGWCVGAAWALVWWLGEWAWERKFAPAGLDRD